MYPQRPDASRGNAYLAPDALTGEKRDKLHDVRQLRLQERRRRANDQVPDTSDDPSCFVQSPPAWPPGNKSPYPHIGAADYSKP